MDITYHTTEPPGTVYAKLVLVHGVGGSGRSMQRSAGLDYLAKQRGIRIYYPTAGFHNWLAQHGLGVASGQIHRLNMMLGDGPLVPVVWGGYSDGCEMAQLCVAAAEQVGDNLLAGGIFYGGHYKDAAPLPRGVCPILLIRNALDKTISEPDLNALETQWQGAGNPTTTMTGRGDHMDLWDQKLNELIDQWLIGALQKHPLYIPH